MTCHGYICCVLISYMNNECYPLSFFPVQCVAKSSQYIFAMFLVTPWNIGVFVIYFYVHKTQRCLYIWPNYYLTMTKLCEFFM